MFPRLQTLSPNLLTAWKPYIMHLLASLTEQGTYVFFMWSYFPRVFCFTWWKNNQNHVFNWPAFQGKNSTCKSVQCSASCRSCWTGTLAETKVPKGAISPCPWPQEILNSLSAPRGALPTFPLVPWPRQAAPNPLNLHVCFLHHRGSSGNAHLWPLSYLPPILDPSLGWSPFPSW